MRGDLYIKHNAICVMGKKSETRVSVCILGYLCGARGRDRSYIHIALTHVHSS